MTARTPELLRHSLGHATAASLTACVFVAASSTAGLLAGGQRYTSSQSVLVSRGADVANLAAVILLLTLIPLARRGSLVALLLWPGALFYLVYAYLPFLIGAPFTPLVFAYVAVFLASGYALVTLLTALDPDGIQRCFGSAHARSTGGLLALIGLLAYAGLVGAAVTAFGSAVTEPAWRGHWVADWILGTPALLLGGVLLWARRPFGYIAAPGLLLVSALGGVVFAAAASFNNVDGGLSTEWSVVIVHLVIGTASLAVLVWYLSARPASRSAGRTSSSPAQP